MGTTGTLMGVKKFFKKKKPEVKIVAIEPPEGHTIQGLKNMKESMVPRIYNPQALDEKITIGDGEAFEITRLLAAKEGIFVGMSSGSRRPEGSGKNTLWHNRCHSAGPRRPIPQHHPVSLNLRKMPALTGYPTARKRYILPCA
jgi:hypothetical protein